MPFSIGTVASGAVDVRMTVDTTLTALPEVISTGDVSLTSTTSLTAVLALVISGDVVMAAEAAMDVRQLPPPPTTTGVLIMLEGGPLDGESQIVQDSPRTAGSRLVFNIPNFQTFDPTDPDAETVIGLGLEAIYAFVSEGPAPGPEDAWTSSWIFTFTGEAFIPTPPLPPQPPQPPTSLVSMSATTTLVPDTIPIETSPSVTLLPVSGLDIDGVVTPFQYGVVAMSGESVLSVVDDWWPEVVMSSEADMDVESS